MITIRITYPNSPANAVRPLGTLSFSNVIDIDNLLVKKTNKHCVFDNQ